MEILENRAQFVKKFQSLLPLFKILRVREDKSPCNISRSNQPFTNRSNVHVRATSVPLMRRSVALQRSTEGYGCNYRTPFRARRISIRPMHRFK